MLDLQGHSSNPSNQNSVKVQYEIRPDGLRVKFTVKSTKRFTQQKFNTTSWDNWGLWNTDVVEVFLQKDDCVSEYLELQISPLGQKFALLVKTPRVSYETPANLNALISAKITEDGFTAEFIIHPDDIPGKGKCIRGNFHACLGDEEHREHYSYILNGEEKADFHRPEFFTNLGNLHE